MRGSWLRQTALSNNIANADTPNYRPQEVDFESTLQTAMEGGESPTEVELSAHEVPGEAGPNGAGVSIDQESAKLSENGLDYEALTRSPPPATRSSNLPSGTCDGALRRHRDRRVGLTAERIRMDVTAENLANADTTKGANGQPYQRQSVELAQTGTPGFSGALSGALRNRAAPRPRAACGRGDRLDTTPDRRVYDPRTPKPTRRAT